jgi:hypothetical protein
MRGTFDGDQTQTHPTLSNEDLRRFAQAPGLGIRR